MVLPGTIWQVPIIEKIKSLGHTLYLTNPKKVCGVYELADYFLETDIFNFDTVSKYLVENKIDLVISDECDIAMDAIAKYNEIIGANFIPFEIAQLFSDKYKMRVFCKENNFCPIPFALCSNKEDALSFFKQKS